MPHKHKRKRGEASDYDLPPSSVAKPLLPVKQTDKTKSKNGAPQKKTKRAKKNEDDTPKAFARMMSMMQKGKAPSGLDDGNLRGDGKKGKKKKGAAAEEEDQIEEEPEQPRYPLKILPGERLADFGARVDAQLPIAGLTTKISKDKAAELGIKERKTKHNKRLQKLIADWRTEDEKIKEAEKEREEEEEVERVVEEDQEAKEARLLWEASERERLKRKGKKQSSKAGAPAADEGDIWASVGRKSVAQVERKGFNSNDVVLAPPTLSGVREKFKVKNGARVQVENVPSAAGSLRKREQLAGERKSVVEEYRRLMAEKRAAGTR